MRRAVDSPASLVLVSPTFSFAAQSSSVGQLRTSGSRRRLPCAHPRPGLHRGGPHMISSTRRGGAGLRGVACLMLATTLEYLATDFLHAAVNEDYTSTTVDGRNSVVLVAAP